MSEVLDALTKVGDLLEVVVAQLGELNQHIAMREADPDTFAKVVQLAREQNRRNPNLTATIVGDRYGLPPRVARRWLEIAEWGDLLTKEQPPERGAIEP